MAEGNANRPAPETLTTEDVDRLSERFKPSWEAEPQTAPQKEPARPALKQTLLGGTAPAPVMPPRAPVAAPAPAPVAAAPPPAAAPAPAAAPVAAKPMTTVSVGKAGIETAKPVVRHPTLVGIAPQAIRQVSGAPQAAPDDLDWELPAGDAPEPPSDMAQTARIVKAPEAAPPKAEASRIQQVQASPVKAPTAPVAPVVAAPARAEPEDPMPVDVEELPPESKPSGIGEKYVPRDQNAPAVVLNEEVQRTEAHALATIEAQHRARSAPTIARMPAVRVPARDADPYADEDTVSHRRKGRRGVWVVLALLTLGGGAAGAALLLRQAEPPTPAAPAPEKPAAVADTAAPPPPAVTAEPPPPEPAPVASAAPEPEASAAAPEPEKQPAKVAAAAPPEAPVEAPKKAPAPAARPSKPKPASTAKAGGTAPRPGKPAVIVRDNPF